MLLDSINSPADLRRLDHRELEQLASEIRAFIVAAVARNGGHLGSNLGAVELTFAVHRVFDSPRDIVLWDTGHQAYTHKIVTGRREGFERLKQADGISGYPNRSESEHDWVENSHASTILSYAHGMATAIAARGEERQVVAIIGDGSMTGGMAYEALNNLGHSGTPAVIIVNDNGRSYAPTVGKLSESLHRLRMSPRYVKRRSQVEHLLADVPVVGGQLGKGVEGLRAALRELFDSTAFYEQLGVRYTGPIDGHDVAAMEDAFRDAAAFDGPVVVHVVTEKGRGYVPALEDDEKRLHDTGAFDVESGPQPKAPGGYTGVFSRTLIELAEEHPEIVAITAAMPGSTGLIPFAERFPERCLDVGIAEQHAVTASAGMAMGGLRPVVAIYSTFLTRGFDQLNLDVGLHGQPVIFAVDRAGITGDDGPSHHGVLDMVLLSKVPGLTLLAPSSAQELEVMLREAVGITSGPVAIRWPKGTAREVASHEVGAGLKGRRLQQGDGSVAILAVGPLLGAALEAADSLRADGVDATVWDVRCVKPLDGEMLSDAARHRLVVTLEDGFREGGAGSRIIDGMAALDGAGRVPATVVLGVPVDYIPHGDVGRIHAALGLNATGIAAATTKALSALDAT